MMAGVMAVITLLIIILTLTNCLPSKDKDLYPIDAATLTDPTDNYNFQIHSASSKDIVFSWDSPLSPDFDHAYLIIENTSYYLDSSTDSTMITISANSFSPNTAIEWYVEVHSDIFRNKSSIRNFFINIYNTITTSSTITSTTSSTITTLTSLTTSTTMTSTLTTLTSSTTTRTSTTRTSTTATSTTIYPPPSRVAVFSTSVDYNGNLGGRAGADAKCQLEYDTNQTALNLAIVRAFISISTTDEIRDMPANYGVPTNIPFQGSAAALANDWNDIISDGQFQNSMSAAGVIGGSFNYWWTFSNSDGSLVASQNCSGGSATSGNGVISNRVTNLLFPGLGGPCTDLRVLVCIGW